MNRDVQQIPNSNGSGNAHAYGLLRRASEQVKERLRNTSETQLDRRRLAFEQSLRRDERSRERTRIARELHDTLFQGFLGASMQLHEAVSQVPEDSSARPALYRALELMRQVLDEGREALNALRLSGVASKSLEQALSSVRDAFTPGVGAQPRVFVKGRPAALKPEIHEQIYLIGREALVNALRHSQATTIEAEVEYSASRVRVVVRDNGCGIDPRVVLTGKTSHWGLAGMRERAESIGAQLHIWSRPGAGTEVEILVPGQIAAAACA